MPISASRANFTFSPSVILVLAMGAAASAAYPATSVVEPSDEEILAGADTRIEEHRKADVILSAVDQSGKPVAGARVTVSQTRHAFLFGSNIFAWGRILGDRKEAAYRKHFSELLNFATLPFYWDAYEPQKGQPNHQHAEQVAQWCQEHEITTKGHPLAWNYSDPRWLPDDNQEIRLLQMARIDDCVSRFSGLIDRWDVVNEATHFDREELLIRRAPKHSGMWKALGQMEFTRECFTHARKAGPGATLLINDYRVDPAYERVIEQLVDPQGKPMYDVIGIQSHMHGGAWPTQKIWKTCQTFSRFDVPLHFTETTILSGERLWQKQPGEPWPSTPEGEEYQARETARLYTVLFSHPAVEAITWWDFADGQAWKGAPAGFLRKDMTPKPVYHELKKLIKGKWWTQSTLQTGPDGKVALRAFLGDYNVTVTADGNKKTERKFTLAKKNDNHWEIEL